MSELTPLRSPQIYARIGGLLYLLIIIVGAFSEGFVRSRLVVPGNVKATAENIVASELLWRTTFAAELILYVCAVALVFIFYVLLTPVNRNIALLAAFFNLVSIAIEAVNSLFHFAPLILLEGASYLKSFDPSQLQALTMLSLEMHEYGFGISLLVFSFALLFNGYLVFRSGFFPRTLGVLLLIAALCYATNSLVLFLAPVLEVVLFPGILLPSLVGELALCLWLIVFGVNVPKWREKQDLLVRRETAAA